MTKPIIVVGDRTSHGGTVIAGSPIADTDGKPIARRNDPVSCPIHGSNHIKEGEDTMVIDGEPVARHGHRTACGATLISGRQQGSSVA